MKKTKWGIVLAAAVTLLSGCGAQDVQTNNDGDKQLKIMTSFYPMYEFTKQIAGNQADVELLIPSSTEPHDWEPTPKDIKKVHDADLFIYNSEYMETFVPTIEAAAEDEGTVFVEASQGIALMEGLEEEEEHHDEEEEHHHDHSHEMDPHVWLSPALAMKEVETITASLIESDPTHEDEYKNNSESYLKELSALDSEYKEKLALVSKKEMITQHAAFGYLAHDYGLEQIAIAGLSPEQEPSAAKLAELKTFASEHDINVIYFEEAASPKVAETLANEIDAKTTVLNTLELVNEEDQKNGLDYISIMKNNLNAIVQAQSE
ncbi:zinc ABC transporter substrate-binding protein [Niallia circulans]|uniref:Zinc ABC transporter substrate-binding protein n=1 Tax=Niallia circulans TaxID=1397 RepID=A0A553SPQ8_NIACI|nr:metal ABC transporter substrate-binding protein [Niallia circulans]TRZ38969.1 zinc ABC transporter substrate-binding protein [Niallia circulans]